jgi:hypothetical protein
MPRACITSDNYSREDGKSQKEIESRRLGYSKMSSIFLPIRLLVPAVASEGIKMGPAVREQTCTLLEWDFQRLKKAGTLISTDSH